MSPAKKAADKTPKAKPPAKLAKPAKAPKPAKAAKPGDKTAATASAPERLFTVLLAPTVSEKATQIADRHSQTVFRVAPDATKPQIKAAVELLFKVEVEAVRIANVKGKSKRFGAYIGRRRNWKKAYVSLKPGQEINFAQEA